MRRIRGIQKNKELLTLNSYYGIFRFIETLPKKLGPAISPFFRRKKQRAFTLIELLVVIGIIGLLAGGVILAINPSSQLISARDAKRKADAREIKNSIIQYLIDNGELPGDKTMPSGQSSRMDICREGAADTSGCLVLDTDLVPDFLSAIPVDPSETDENLVGYSVYQEQGGFVEVVAEYLGQAPVAGTTGGSGGGGSSEGGGSSSSAAGNISGLVAHWRFDLGAGTYAPDSVSYYEGVLEAMDDSDWVSGAPATQFANSGALIFDGGNDRVDVGMRTFAATEGTITLWAHADDDSTQPMHIFSRNNSGLNDGDFALIIDPAEDKPRFYIENSSESTDAYANSAMSLYTWYHYAVTWDADEVAIWVDGVKQTTTGAGLEILAHGSDTIAIGHSSGVGSQGNGYAYDGTIDDVRVYDSVLTSDQISAIYDGTDSGAAWDAALCNTLAGHWKFDDGPGSTTAADATSYSNDGTLTSMDENSDWIDPSNSTISFSNPYALDFDGSDDYVTMGDVVNNLWFPLSISAWINTPGGASQNIFASDNNPTDAGDYYGFWIRAGGGNNLALEFGDGTGAGSEDRRGLVSTGTIPTNEWVHVGGVIKSSDDMEIYINGVDTGGSYTGSATSMSQNTYAAEIGRRFRWSSWPFAGQIDDVRLYYGLLTPEDMARLANGGGECN